MSLKPITAACESLGESADKREVSLQMTTKITSDYKGDCVLPAIKYPRQGARTWRLDLNEGRL